MGKLEDRKDKKGKPDSYDGRGLTKEGEAYDNRCSIRDSKKISLVRALNVIT